MSPTQALLQDRTIVHCWAKPKSPAGCGSTVVGAAEPLEDEAVAHNRA